MDFSHTRITFNRRLTSYSKVQALIGHGLRNRRAQLASGDPCDYVNVGCGSNVALGFLNLDYEWKPGVVCWDVRRGLPLADASVKGIFSEHCLEHLELDAGFELM